MSRASLQRSRLCVKPLAAGIAALVVSVASASHANAGAPAASIRASIGPDFAFRSQVASAGGPRLPQRIGSILPVTSCADDNTTGTFRSVVAGAIDGDTIDLSQLTCGTITLALGAVTTAVDNLAIQGPGQTALTIDGAHADRVVVLSGAGTLAISDLSITNGYLAGDYNGGCVRSYGNISLTRTTVSGCQIAAIGYAAGGGAAARANMTLIDSNVSGNTVSASSNYYGYLFGGGVNAVGTMVISNSTISGNTQQFLGEITPYSIAYGGGVSARYDVTITASTIDGNQGATYGGGLFVIGNPNAFSRVEIVNSTISGNSASIGGGGVSVGGLFRTYLSSFVMHSCTVAENVSQGGGGGLRFRDYTLADVQSSIIAGNIAAAGADHRRGRNPRHLRSRQSHRRSGRGYRASGRYAARRSDAAAAGRQRRRDAHACTRDREPGDRCRQRLLRSRLRPARRRFRARIADRGPISAHSRARVPIAFSRTDSTEPRNDVVMPRATVCFQRLRSAFCPCRCMVIRCTS